MDDVIKLIAKVSTKDDNGYTRSIETSRDVFAKIKSVTQTEFFAGGRQGLNPSQQFVIATVDYAGEDIIEWRGNRYAVYRVYTDDKGTGDYTELYTERKGGTNVGKNDQYVP